jgi:hypothetical protein
MVDVFYYGTSADWDGIRQGFEDNREGTTDVAGVGEEAFNPNDMGAGELVVLAGDVAYEVAAYDEASGADVVELATAIASTVG